MNKVLGVHQILDVHECEEARAHHDTGPHPDCSCRVCGLQRRIEELEVKVQDMHYEMLEAGERADG